MRRGLHEVAEYMVLPGVHQPTTATAYVANQAAFDKLSDQHRSALEVTAREVSGALRQDIMVSNAEYVEKFVESGVEIIELDPQDVINSRGKAIVSWDKAAGDNALAKEILGSQRELMEDYRLI